MIFCIVLHLKIVIVQREQAAGRGGTNRVVAASWSTGSLPATVRGANRGSFRGNRGSRNGRQFFGRQFRRAGGGRRGRYY
jgi:hypothetical protein